MLSFIYAYIIDILHVCNQVPTSPVVYDIEYITGFRYVKFLRGCIVASSKPPTLASMSHAAQAAAQRDRVPHFAACVTHAPQVGFAALGGAMIIMIYIS